MAWPAEGPTRQSSEASRPWWNVRSLSIAGDLPTPSPSAWVLCRGAGRCRRVLRATPRSQPGYADGPRSVPDLLGEHVPCRHRLDDGRLVPSPWLGVLAPSAVSIVLPSGKGALGPVSATSALTTLATTTVGPCLPARSARRGGDGSGSWRSARWWRGVPRRRSSGSTESARWCRRLVGEWSGGERAGRGGSSRGLDDVGSVAVAAHVRALHDRQLRRTATWSSTTAPCLAPMCCSSSWAGLGSWRISGRATAPM